MNGNRQTNSMAPNPLMDFYVSYLKKSVAGSSQHPAIASKMPLVRAAISRAADIRSETRKSSNFYNDIYGTMSRGYQPNHGFSSGHARTDIESDRFLAPQHKRFISNSMPERRGMITGGDVARGLIGAGVGYATAGLVGSTLGTIFGMSRSTQRKLRAGGAIAGAIYNTGLFKSATLADRIVSWRGTPDDPAKASVPALIGTWRRYTGAVPGDTAPLPFRHIGGPLTHAVVNTALGAGAGYLLGRYLYPFINPEVDPKSTGRRGALIGGAVLGLPRVPELMFQAGKYGLGGINSTPESRAYNTLMNSPLNTEDYKTRYSNAV